MRLPIALACGCILTWAQTTPLSSWTSSRLPPSMTGLTWAPWVAVCPLSTLPSLVECNIVLPTSSSSPPCLAPCYHRRLNSTCHGCRWHPFGARNVGLGSVVWTSYEQAEAQLRAPKAPPRARRSFLSDCVLAEASCSGTATGRRACSKSRPSGGRRMLG